MSAVDWPGNRFLRDFGVRIEELREGYARLSIPRDQVRLRGARDSINGGLVAALGNAAMQVCLSTVLGPGERAGRTHELTVAYLTSAIGDVTSIEARILRKGGRVVVGEVELRDTSDNALNSKLRVTCEIERVRPDAG